MAIKSTFLNVPESQIQLLQLFRRFDLDCGGSFKYQLRRVLRKFPSIWTTGEMLRFGHRTASLKLYKTGSAIWKKISVLKLVFQKDMQDKQDFLIIQFLNCFLPEEM